MKFRKMLAAMLRKASVFLDSNDTPEENGSFKKGPVDLPMKEIDVELPMDKRYRVSNPDNLLFECVSVKPGHDGKLCSMRSITHDKDVSMMFSEQAIPLLFMEVSDVIDVMPMIEKARKHKKVS